MNSRTLLILLATGACLTTSGCDKVKRLVGGKPSGQVVATVDGQEITSLELKQELGSFSSRDPNVMKQAQQQALQSIIMRRLAAQEAKAEKIDKSSEYTLQVSRGEEALLAQLLERKIAQAVPPPTQRAAEAFVQAHPDQFANRRILTLDQLIAPVSKIDASKLKDLKTLDEVKHQFDADKVPYQESSAELDTLSAPPGVIAEIAKLPPGAVFAVPQNGAAVFSRVAAVKSAPLGGEMATNYAMRYLSQQQARDAVRKRFQTMRQGAESKIVYAAAYKPPPSATYAPAAALAGKK